MRRCISKFMDQRQRRRATRRSRKGGFTLLEVIVVVTIIALLATLVAPRLLRHVGGAKRRAALAEASTIAEQLNLYMLDQGWDRPPSDLELNELAQGDDPYLKEKDLIDPWGNPYVLIVPGEYNIDFDVVSYGADGEPGGEGDAKDIINGMDDV